MSPKKAAATLLISVAVMACSLFARQSGAEAVPFKPDTDISLKAGDHHFTEFTIAGEVTVSLEGDVVIRVDGPIRIDGEVKGECNGVEMRGGESFVLEGLISTECADGQLGPEMRLIAAGDITVGAKTSDKPAIRAGGDVVIGDPEGEDIDWSQVVNGDPGEESQRPSAPHLAAPAAQVSGGTITINQPIQPGAGGSISIPANKQNAAIVIAASLSANDGRSGTDLNQAGTCDASADEGQRGGNLRLAAPNGSLTIAGGVTLKAGDGGAGADCVAEGPTGDQMAVASDGGKGGSLLVGGRGLVFGNGVTLTRASGGPGGSAFATGADGEEACSSGFNASATAGSGGDTGSMGYLSFDPASVEGAPKVQGGNGGDAGDATAIGGDGMPCDVCPGGEGGSGGNAVAAGGTGGNGATRSLGFEIIDGHKKGDGGDASALAGDGGQGASCCNPIEFGGNGGQGGDSTANGGPQGSKGLNEGTPGRSDQSMAGDGGNGGDGIPWGAGWAGGTGQGSPQPIEDGSDGMDGNACAQPVTTVFDETFDGLICADFSPYEEKLPGFADITQVDVEPVSPTEVQFTVSYGRVPDLKSAWAETPGIGWAMGIQFNDPEQPDPPVTNWAADGLGGVSANAFLNNQTGELVSDLAVYQDGQWTRPGGSYPTEIISNSVVVTIPVEDIPAGGKGVATSALFLDSIVQAVCDVAGLDLNGRPGIEIQTFVEATVPDTPPIGVPDTVITETNWTGTYEVTVEVGEDPGFHAIPIGAPVTTTFEVVQQESALTMAFEKPFLPVSGTVNSDGTFELTGTGEVAGIPNIQVEAIGNFNSIHMAYTIGVNGGLPGGFPITYFLDGERVDGMGETGGTGSPEDVETFFTVFNSSFVTQDADFLYNQLHPAVLDRYGADQCRAYLESVVTTPLEIANFTVTDFGTWVWERDGVSTTVPDTFTIEGVAIAQGESAETELHLAVRPDGSIGWFTDCGEPQ